MVRIYRVEHTKSHQGPFTNPEEDYQRREQLRDALSYALEAGWPSLYEDWPKSWPVYEDTSKYYCGVPAREHVFYWFTKEVLVILAQAGYKLFLIEVPEEDVLFGKSGKQVFFKKENARVVEEELLCA